MILAASILATVLPWALLLLGLGFVIFVHELGHFLVAKRSGVKVERFSIGFGPRLLAFTRGETEYCISAIPLGGYVKMLGEEPEDEGKHDPRSFSAQPALWRTAILLAGVGMNTLAAVPLLWTALMLGATFTANRASVVGSVAEGSLAEKAGLLPGDRIVEVRAEPVERWLELEALGAGASIGLANERHDRLGAIDPEELPPFAAAREGDFLVRVDGAPFASRGQLAEAVRAKPGGTIVLGLARGEGGRPGVPYEVRLPVGSQDQFQSDLSVDALPGTMVGDFTGPESPAKKAGLLPGDRISAVNGREVSTWEEMRREIGGSAEKPIRVSVDRGGRALEVAIDPLGSPAAKGTPIRLAYLRDGIRTGLEIVKPGPGYLIGITPAYRVSAASGAAAEAGAAAGDQILSAVFTPEKGPGEPWPIPSLTSPNAAGGTLAVTVRQGDGTRTLSWPLRRTPVGTAKLPEGFVERVHPRYGASGWHRAIAGSVRESAWILTFSVRRLADLVSSLGRGESEVLRQLSGPLGIGALTYVSIQQGYSQFLWMLGLVSLSLALMNVLPIPLLDGGHLLFLAIEKLRGRPLSDRIQIYAQYTSLALLLTLVLYATWNDIGIIGKILPKGGP